MKGLSRVAVMMGMVAVSAASVEAAEIQRPDEVIVVTDDVLTTEVVVVNNYLTDVRVYAEDDEGRLHTLGRIARGELKFFSIPEAAAYGHFRIKVFPSSPAWSPIADDFGVKTNPLNVETDRMVRVWLEADLTQSLVEIERG